MDRKIVFWYHSLIPITLDMISSRSLALTTHKNSFWNNLIFIPKLFFKVDEERCKTSSVLREKQELHEKWVEIDRKLEKVQHEFSVKEAQNRAVQVIMSSFWASAYAIIQIALIFLRLSGCITRLHNGQIHSKKGHSWDRLCQWSAYL